MYVCMYVYVYVYIHIHIHIFISGFASSGNTIVFMGGFGSVAVMNEIFGWSIRPVSYQVIKLIKPCLVPGY
jgi:hypothetical protein